MALLLLIITASTMFCGLLPKVNGRNLKSTFENQACTVNPPLDCIEEPEVYSKWRSLPLLNASEGARFDHGEMDRMSCEEALKIYSDHERVPASEIVPPIVWVAYQETDREFEGSKLKKVTHIRSEPDGTPCQRKDFTSRWNARMTALDARGYKVDKDEKGHILASQLCGPIEWYNLAPQTPAVNRNIGRAGQYGWCNLENELKRFLQNNCGHIVMDVFLNYENEQAVRPKGFKVCALYLDRNGFTTDSWDRYFDNEI